MFTLGKVVPWGCSFEESSAMFSLAEADMAGRILGWGDGPASFNAESTRRGAEVVSCDPVYSFGNADVEARVSAAYE